MKQMLIYDNVVPVTRDQHGKLALKPTGDYDFARQTNSVPLVVGEFALTAMHYAIVFGQTPDGPIPAAVLGVRDNENAFISADGNWGAPYIPAFIRRYPFVFGTDAKNETFTLMIDEKYPGLNTHGKGERLFDADGEQTVFLKNIMGFLSEYQGQVQATQAFSKKLADLGLLDGAEAHLPTPADPERRLRGFTIVSREKLRALPPEKLAELNASGELELIYLHLLSLNNLQRLPEKAAAPAAA
ncbi:MAG: SapC family protein [Alphaproteobacteria bacterium]|nr:SapC family protein [Alphaproteobacteria bacterium]